MLIAKTVKEKSNSSRPSGELGLSNSGKVSRFWEIGFEKVWATSHDPINKWYLP